VAKGGLLDTGETQDIHARPVSQLLTRILKGSLSKDGSQRLLQGNMVLVRNGGILPGIPDNLEEFHKPLFPFVLRQQRVSRKS